jgi:hypothetical protein
MIPLIELDVRVRDISFLETDFDTCEFRDAEDLVSGFLRLGGGVDADYSEGG